MSILQCFRISFQNLQMGADEYVMHIEIFMGILGCHRRFPRQSGISRETLNESYYVWFLGVLRNIQVDVK